MTYEELLKEIEKLKTENKNLQIIIENKDLEIDNLKRVIFASKRESKVKVDRFENGEQCSLFEEETNKEEIINDIKNATRENTVCNTKKKKAKKSGIDRRFLNNVPVEIETYTIEEGAKCPICDEDLIQIGKEFVRQEIEYVPAKLIIKNIVRAVYKCKFVNVFLFHFIFNFSIINFSLFD